MVMQKLLLYSMAILDLLDSTNSIGLDPRSIIGLVFEDQHMPSPTAGSSLDRHTLFLPLLRASKYGRRHRNVCRSINGRTTVLVWCGGYTLHPHHA